MHHFSNHRNRQPHTQIATATSGPEQDSMPGAGGGGEGGGELDDDELMEPMDQARDRGLL